MNDSDPDLANLFWMELPEWADDVPENGVLYMLEEFATRNKIPLTRYDPSDPSVKEEKGRKVVLVKKSELAKRKCEACGKENDHFSFLCPNDPDRELMEQTHINGVKVPLYCALCGKLDEHTSWNCPEPEPIPFGPMDVGDDMICENCGAEDDHWADCCPRKKHPPAEPEPGFRECVLCHKYGDSQHWTEDCPQLGPDGCNKFCWNCESVGDHDTDDCCKFFHPVIFCMCCAARGDHTTEDCPREDKDGRKYFEVCDWLGDHSTRHCPLLETRADHVERYSSSK